MYKHGITTRETATSVSAVRTDGITPFYVGTAPVNLGDVKNVNKVVLCNTYEEAVKNFGFVDDFENYTLCEAIDCHFSKFNIAPIVLVNVLDPDKHKKEETESYPLDAENKIVVPKKGILKDTVKLEPAKKFKSLFNENGELVIVITDTDIQSTRSFKVTYNYLDPSMITPKEIIGGIDSETGLNKGLECVEDVFPVTRKVPNLILAPKFSTDSTVAAVLETKARLINGHFKALALADIDTTKVKKYTDAPKTKEKNNLNSTYLTVDYPKVALGTNQYHLSTQKACQIQLLASNSDGVPYQSPSNISLKADKACLSDGSDVILAINQANYLNENGIGTAINWTAGWKSWGNRTSCYPGCTDAKDNFIALRNMFNFLNNTLILNFWEKVDKPTNLNLIKFFKDSINIWLNGLQAAGYLLGARVEFRKEDNPLTSLLNGHIIFKIYYTPPIPLESAEFDCEIDVNYFNNLFAA